MTRNREKLQAKKQSVVLSLPRFLDERGNLSFFENGNQIPFEIKRVHWIFDVPGGEERGGLAYKETEETSLSMMEPLARQSH